MEGQRWLPLEANPEVSRLRSRPEAVGRSGGDWVAAASPGQFVAKSCSLFRFQVTNQVSEVSCRSGPGSPPWLRTPLPSSGV